MAARPDRKVSEDKDKPGKRGKGLLIGVIASILIAACVAAGWYFTRPAAQEDTDEAQASRKSADAIFVNLEPFTVNLADEGGERLAQVAMVLEMGNQEAKAALSKNLPIVRNRILLLLSAQHTKTLLTLDGKQALADEVVLRTGTALGWKPEQAQAQEVEEGKRTQAPQDKQAQARKVATRKPMDRTGREPQPNPVVAVHFSQLLVQ